MRSLLAGLAGLLAVLLLPVALLVSWVSSVGTDTDQFVTRMAPVISTPSVQRALTDRVVTIVKERLRLDARVARQIDAPLRELVGEAVASRQVKQAWTVGIRGAHREFVAVMDGREPARVDSTGRVVMPLTVPLPDAERTLRRFGIVNEEAFRPSLPIPLFAAADLSPARRAYAIGSVAGPQAVWLAIGLGVVAVAVARNRIRAVGWLGVGGVLAAVGLATALVLGRTAAAETVADPTGAALVRAAYGLAEDGLMAEARLAVIVSGVLVVAAIVAGLIRRFARSNG